MRYQVHQPSPALPHGIRAIWMLSADADPGASPQRVVPDGCVEVILNVSDRFRHLPAGATPVTQPAGMVVGDARRPMVIQPTGAIDIIGIRFEPGHAAPFLGAPMRELIDRAFDLSDVSPALHRGLLGPVAAARGDVARVLAIESALARHYRKRLAPDSRLAHAAVAVTRSLGRARLDHITRSTGVSSRWLQRHFHDAVGFGPKLLGRLARFQALVGALERKAAPHWARLAAEHGYYDQSHLIRDFRRFAGTSPGEYLREPNALNALFAQS